MNNPSASGESRREDGAPTGRFHDQFVDLFNAHFRSLFRYLDRLSGDPDLAADLAQEAFIKLYRRGSMPDSPNAWLLTVSMNLFRNARSSRSRRNRLLTITRAESVHSEPQPSAETVQIEAESARQVRSAMDRIPERDQRLLLLVAEGHSYRDVAASIGLHEASVGTLLARARRAFRAAYEEERSASR